MPIVAASSRMGADQAKATTSWGEREEMIGMPHAPEFPSAGTPAQVILCEAGFDHTHNNLNRGSSFLGPPPLGLMSAFHLWTLNCC